MASAQLSSSAMEIADSLNQADIPIKFRCAICGRLALNAVRLPCCDQNICDKCQSALPESCPICAHSPLSPDAAKPLKALRLTVLAFLKSVEKKREKERAATKSASQVVEAPPVPATPTATVDPNSSSDTIGSAAPFDDNVQPAAAEYNAPAGAQDASEVAQADDPADLDLDLDYSIEQSTEEAPPYQTDAREQGCSEPPVERADAEEDEDDSRSVAASDETEIVTGDEVQYDENGNRIYPAAEEEHLDEQYNPWMQGNGGHDQSQAYVGGYGQDGSQPNFPHMPWNGAQNPAQAQMLQQMQMQMQNAGWGGNANMMGAMPGMPGMTPMDMQTMMAQFGMPGMGGMNPAMANMMGMNGMGGMNGMMGMDFSGAGFDGWNNGQQMAGGYGASNGFYPAGGFNQSHQGQFPQMSHHQQYPKNNFHNQNRFQGPQRGGYGYGRGYHNQGNGSFHQQQSHLQSSGPPPGAPKGPKGAQGGFQGNNDPFHHQLPQRAQSRGSSQAMSVDRQPLLKENVQQSNEFGEAQDENTTVRPAPDNLDAPDPSDKDASGSGKAGNTNDSELTQQERQAESGALAEEQVSNAADESRTDQLQLDHMQDSTANQVDTAFANEGNYYGNTAMADQTNDFSNYGQNNHQGQSHDTLHMQQSAQQFGRGAFRGRGSQDMRGGFRGRGGTNWQYHGTHGPLQGEGMAQGALEPKGTGVQGAPKGPKAMREGLPNTGWSGRGGRGGFGSPARGGANVPASPMAATHTSDVTNDQVEKTEPERARSRTKSRSRSRSRSRTPRRQRSRNDRSRTPSSESGYDRKRESRRHRSSRKHDEDDVDMEQPNSHEYDDDKDYDRSRDKDRHRSSKSHRDSSRRRHRRRSRSRSRSRSPAREDDVGASSRDDKSRDKHRDRSRDREREERDRDRRDRDKKRSRRDRSESRDSDRHHRSSRRSKKDKDRDRDRDRESTSARTSQPQTPVEPEVEFKFQGRSKDRAKPTPTGPATMQPPTGPRTQLPPKNQIKLSLGTTTATRPIATAKPSSSRRSQPPTPTSAAASLPPTPTSTNAAPVDPYQLEREARIRERERKEEQRRASLHGSSGAAGRKRSIDDVSGGFTPPTGPRSGSGGAGGGSGAKRVREASGKSRRVSYKYEDEVDGAKGEREREGGRF